MRQLPANNSGATGTTDNSRSRPHPSNDLHGTKGLTNGAVKEPILTRSKTKLRGGRRLLDRQFKRLLSKSSNQYKHSSHETENASKRKQEKVSTSNNSSSSNSPKSNAGANTSFITTTSDKIYARHYKSYRRLNGVKSRRGDSSFVDDEPSRWSPVDLQKEVRSNSSSSSQKSSSLSLSNIRKVPTRDSHLRQNGISVSKTPSESMSSSVTKRSPSQRIRRLMLKRKSQQQQRISLRRKEKEDRFDEEDQEDKCNKTISNHCTSLPASRKEEGKGKGEHQNNNTTSTNNTCTRVVKRRSALWVLNCEAESFLFGETAAEKHEVELPPLAPPSPPPKKRRWRVNELGALLEKSPGILESKLRKSSSSESGGDTPKNGSLSRKRLKSDIQQRRNASKRTKTEKEKNDYKKAPKMCSSKAVKSRSNDDKQPEEHEIKNERREVDEVLSPLPELLSPIPFLYSPDSVDYEAKTVQFQQMLSGLNFRYSFEWPLNKDEWFRTFERTSDDIIPYTSFQSPLSQSVPLPYEMDKQIRRSRSKPVRNSRKSPRCHASTLAILSSEKPTRSTRSSVTQENSSVNNLSTESVPSARLKSSPSDPAPSNPPTSTLPLPSPPTPATSSRLLSPPKCIPPSRRRHLSSIRTNHTDSIEELGAAQYLWDSIQFLSDPYVVALLSGDDPEEKTRRHFDPHDYLDNNKVRTKGLAKNYRCNNNNYVNCPVKNFIKNLETSERKASLRSGGDGITSTSSVNSTINNLTNSRLVSVPKSSPRNHQSQQCTNHVGGNRSCSPPSSPKVNDRVPAVNGVTKRFTSRSPPLIHPSSKQTHECRHGHNSMHTASKMSPKNSKGSATTNLSAKQLAKPPKRPISGSSEGDTTTGKNDDDNGLITRSETPCKRTAVVLVSDLFITTTKTNLNNWDEKSLFIGDELPPLPSWPV